MLNCHPKALTLVRHAHIDIDICLSWHPPHRRPNPAVAIPVVPAAVPSAAASSPATLSWSWSRRHCTAVGVVFARPTRAVIAPWSCRGHAIVRAIIAPLSHIFAPLVVIVRVVVGRLAPRRVRRCVGLASEWWWWLAVGVHVWEWRRWWTSVGPVAVTVVVLPLHTGHPLYSRDNIAGTQSTTPPRPVPWPPHPPPLLGFGPLKIHFLLPKSPWPPPPPLSSTQPVAAASNPSPRTSSPPPPPLTARKSRRNATVTPPAAAGLRPFPVAASASTFQYTARGRRLQPIAMHEFAATTTPHSAQEPSQRHRRTVHNPHRYDTNDDGDAAGTAQRQERW
ncbi:hypothetical protein EDB84DRAFT_1441892 [Lactarius hengduanensis]|nr:hypothetical protein EDB84DRAFT_1441892 [Lactarius hengduanensis]